MISSPSPFKDFLIKSYMRDESEYNFMEETSIRKTVLVNVEENEIRVAYLENQQLVDLFIEKIDDLSLVGNIYKGVVEDVVPGLQAAFVDIGQERRAFLHYDDILTDALKIGRKEKKAVSRRGSAPVRKQGASSSEKWNGAQPRSGADTMERKRIHKGQTLLVQVIKDEIGGKGPRVTTNISLPGRYLVFLPYPSQRGGISRKIEDEKERQRLRRILGEIKNTRQSYIIRTAGMGMDDDAIKGDMGNLKSAWGGILRKYRQPGIRSRFSGAGKDAPLLLFNDHDILYRIVRDNITDDVNEIITNDERVYKDLRRILRHMIPSLEGRVNLFSHPESLFQHYDVEKKIQRACQRKIWLKSGGYVVFDETEALTAIDVNSGRFVGKKDQEKNTLKTNLEAAKMIAQQLRLRDIGGIIVIDFIDMSEKGNREAVEQEFLRQTKQDKAKISTVPISEFGLLQVTRKRVRMSLWHQIYNRCPYCGGSGRVLAPDQIWREMKYSILNLLQKTPRPLEITVVLHSHTKNYIQEKFITTLKDFQKHYKVPIILLASEDLHVEDFQVRYVHPDRAEVRVQEDMRRGAEDDGSEPPSETRRGAIDED